MREREKIQTYLTEGCGCVKNCSSFYDESYVTKIRSDCAELTNGELDMVVMGQLLGFVEDSQETGGIRHNPQLRQRMSCQFLHRGVKVNIKIRYYIKITFISLV